MFVTEPVLKNKTVSNSTEAALLKRLLDRDEKALSLLYDKYSPALYGVILRILKCEYQAQDSLQECFVKIWNAIAIYDPEKGRLFTWMINICRNHAIDKTRSRIYRAKLKTRNIAEVTISASCTKMERHSVHIGIKELTELLLPEQKEIIDLIYYNGFTQAEAAEILELPLGTVKTRARKAILILRGYFL